VEERVAPWREIGCDLLLDADAGSQGGGAGLRLDWTAIGRWSAQFGAKDSWALAGGLTPQSVSKAIAASGAKSVDVASGVEQPRGIKSAELISSFVEHSGLSRFK
jgi:phosphoribosylanthranilate isomerase